MTRNRRFLVPLLVTLLVLSLAGGAVVYAQGSGFDLSWWTVDGGGGSLSNGDYTLDGTIGQPDAGSLSEGDYVLYGGFWAGGGTAAGGYDVYLPLVLRDRS